MDTITGVMQLATRKVPALNQRPQLSANSSAQQRDMLRLVQQFPRLQVQAPNQHQPPHYQAPQLMETLGAAQLPQRQVQALNLKQQSLCQAPQLIQSPTTTQRLPFQPSSSQLQLHSGHLIMYNTSRNNQSSNRTRVFSQGHRYQLQQFPRKQPLTHLPYQQGQPQQQQQYAASERTIQQAVDAYAQYDPGQSRNNNSNMHSQKQNWSSLGYSVPLRWVFTILLSSLVLLFLYLCSCLFASLTFSLGFLIYLCLIFHAFRKTCQRLMEQSSSH